MAFYTAGRAGSGSVLTFVSSCERSFCSFDFKINLSKFFLLSKFHYSTKIMSQIELAKKKAACMAVDLHVKTGFNIGIGSGSTIVYAVERLAERVKEEGLKVTCVPTSFQARQLIIAKGLTLSDLEITPQLDVTIDGADEVDQNFVLIKGGGGCLLQEKVVAAAAQKFIVIADYRKKSTELGENWHKGVPVEVVGMAYRPAMASIEAKLGGEARLRQAVAKAGPVVTDNGNLIIDWVFTGKKDWTAVHNTIKLIPGVVETGLFVGMADAVFFGYENGEVQVEINNKK